MTITGNRTDFLAEVNRRSGQTIQRCYFCRKCASGCPVSVFYDYLPYQVLRLVQFGLTREALRSSTIWLCSTCGTCAARCPNDIDLVKVMDTLKEMSIEEGAKAGENQVKLFHRLFLGNLKRFGRLHEATLLGSLKFRTGHFFKDAGLGIKMLRKGMIPLFPKKIKGVSEVRELFKKVREESP